MQEINSGFRYRGLYRRAKEVLVQFSAQTDGGELKLSVGCDAPFLAKELHWQLDTSGPNDAEPDWRRSSLRLLDVWCGPFSVFIQRTHEGLLSPVKLPDCMLDPGVSLAMKFVGGARGRILGYVSGIVIVPFGSEEAPAQATHERFAGESALRDPERPSLFSAGEMALFSTDPESQNWMVVETDNYGRDYPDERSHGPLLSQKSACEVAKVFNEHSAPDRFFKVEHRSYTLQGGFKP